MSWSTTLSPTPATSPTSRRSPTSPRYSFVHGDIRDGDLLDEVLPGVDTVVHFAAESHVDRSVRDSGPFVETNVVGTQRLLDASLRAGIRRFVHVSTDEVYGSIAEGSWDETRPLEPNSPYSASKAGSDLLARSYHRTHGMNLSITRCSNNYGPYHFPEKVIPLFVTNLIDDKHVPLYGEGENIRDWLHVDDHTRGIALVVDRRPGRRDLQHRRRHRADQPRADPAAARRDRPRLVVRRPVDDRKGHDLRYSVDISKIRDELGYEPLVPFERGLADVVQWYRDHRDWWEPLKTRAALA